MATERWIAGSGQGLTWGAANTSSTLFDALAAGNALMSDLDIANAGTNLDLFADLSLALTSAAFVAPNFIGVYVYPLNEDGTTYGDGRFSGTAAAGPPSSNYWVGNIGIVAATQAQEGTLRGIILPPGTFRFVLYNQGGVTLGSTNVLKYRTYNRQVT